MTRLMKTSVVLFAVFLTAACADTRRWENPNLPPGQWAKDLADCRRGVMAQIDREQTREESYLGRGMEPGADPLRTKMLRHDIVKRQDRLIADCMRGRGYFKVEPGATQ